MMSQKTQRSFAAKCRRAPSSSSRTKSRHDRQRDQLRVRVLERRARRRAVVLEHQDVAEAAVALEIEHPLAERPQHPLDLRLRHRRQRLDRDRGVSMITSCAPMPFIRSNMPSPSRSSVPSTCSAGNLFGTTRSVPAGRVRRAAVLPVREHLGRRHVLVARAERALIAPERRCPLEPEIVRTLPPVGRDDDPAAGDGIFTEFRQCSR